MVNRCLGCHSRRALWHAYLPALRDHVAISAGHFEGVAFLADG